MARLRPFAKFHQEAAHIHKSAGNADRPREVADDRHAVSRGFQEAYRLKDDGRTPLIGIERPETVRLQRGGERGADHVRLHLSVSHIHIGSQRFGLHRHTEGDAVVLETAVSAEGAGQRGHFRRIEMRLRPCTAGRSHDIGDDHVHHSARTDAGRAVNGRQMRRRIEPLRRRHRHRACAFAVSLLTSLTASVAFAE